MKDIYLKNKRNKQNSYQLSTFEKLSKEKLDFGDDQYYSNFNLKN